MGLNIDATVKALTKDLAENLDRYVGMPMDAQTIAAMKNEAAAMMGQISAVPPDIKEIPKEEIAADYRRAALVLVDISNSVDPYTMPPADLRRTVNLAEKTISSLRAGFDDLREAQLTTAVRRLEERLPLTFMDRQLLGSMAHWVDYRSGVILQDDQTHHMSISIKPIAPAKHIEINMEIN